MVTYVLIYIPLSITCCMFQAALIVSYLIPLVIFAILVFLRTKINPRRSNEGETHTNTFHNVSSSHQYHKRTTPTMNCLSLHCRISVS